MIQFRRSTRLTEFEARILVHLDGAYSLARFLMRNEHDTEDVVQEATLRAFRFYDGFRGENSRAWFLRVVRNTAFTALKRMSHREQEVEFDEELHTAEDASAVPAIRIDQQLNRQAVREAIEELPPEFREVIALRELEGCAYKEIADITSVPIGTVMSRLARARRHLYPILAAKFPERAST
jgi:RNA polymerase sigma-70 factor (ECF subfamily)